jgi:hypothetical protein
VIYRPPDGSKYLSKCFDDDINDCLIKATLESKEIILLGDFNINYKKRNDHRELKMIFQSHGLLQLVKTDTRVTKGTSSLIDLIFTNTSSLIITCDVIPSDISDHHMVACIRKKNYQKFNPRVTTSRTYKNYNPLKMNEDFSKVDWKDVYNESDVNKAVELFNTILLTIFNKHAPVIKKTVRGQRSDWINHEIKESMAQRDRIFRKARKSKTTADWNLYKRARNSCNNKVKAAKTTFHKELLNENSNNPRKFWDTIKKIFPYKTKSVNNNTQNEKITAEAFGNYFATAIKLLKEKSSLLTNFVWKYPLKQKVRTHKIFQAQYISHLFVSNQLKNLQRRKATGIDGLPSNMLKDCREFISKPLCHILNLSIRTGKVPETWKMAKLKPLHKSGATNDPSNYRPISVLPILSKILERAMHSQLLSYLEKNNLLTECQFGYRQNRSTTHATTLLIDGIREEVDKGKLVGSCFIDLSKAFDTISHSQLLAKLKSYGVVNRELLWFTDYLFKATQIVELDSSRSSEKPLLCGVPQGSILGPLLFLIFFNDVVDHVRYSHILKYADDTIIYVAAKELNEIENALTADLKAIDQYLRDNDLVINMNKGKTEVMLFGTNKKRGNKHLNVSYRDEPINETTSYKYLGILLDQSLTLSENFAQTYKKASSRLHLLHKLRVHVNQDVAKRIYQTMILPILTYSSTASLHFTATQLKQLES